MKCRSKNNKTEVAKEPHLTLESSIAKMKKGEKLAERRSKNSKNEVAKKRKGEKIRKQYVWWKINPCCVRKESIADFHGLSIHSKISRKKVLLVDNDVATDMDLRADEISGNKNGMA